MDCVDHQQSHPERPESLVNEEPDERFEEDLSGQHAAHDEYESVLEQHKSEIINVFVSALLEVEVGFEHIILCWLGGHNLKGWFATDGVLTLQGVQEALRVNVRVVKRGNLGEVQGSRLHYLDWLDDDDWLRLGRHRKGPLAFSHANFVRS